MRNKIVLPLLTAIVAPLGLLLSCASLPGAGQDPVALAAQYADFRERTQATHEAAGAGAAGMTFEHRYLQVGTVRWHYVEVGDSAGPTVLLLHGLPESWYSWSKVLPLLDPSFHYIVPDMKGYGQSSATDSDYGWHRVARQTLDLMDALGVGKFFIVGHDWGALISSVMVSDHPERFLGYVRMEADLNYSPGQSLEQLYKQKPQWKLFQDRAKAVSMLSDAGPLIDLVYPSRMKTRFGKADRDYFVYEFSRPGVAEAISGYFQASNWDLEAAVSKIAHNTYDFPVLQLQADSDSSQPASSFTDASARWPGVRLEWITDASHFDNLDQPGQVADAINRFLAASFAGDGSAGAASGSTSR
ncbi:MAG: alpha/beta hydrolase [Spirochaetota bacterium]